MGEKKQKILTVDDILGAIDLEEREVFVPQWNGSVKIKPFTKDQQQIARKKAQHGGKIDVDTYEMIIFVEGVSEPKFTESQVNELKNKNAAAIDLVLKEIFKLSGIDDDESKQAEKDFFSAE